jgi:GNAT superfamily N-acetyltransferase
MSEGDAAYVERLDGGLLVRASDRPDSPLLERFFDGYDGAFVLPDEREELVGFRDCLALNASMPVFRDRSHREYVLVVEGVDGSLLGGANFLAVRIDQEGGPPVSIALNYVYVDRAARGRGLSRTLLAAVGRVGNRALLAGGSLPPAIFLEQNDPLRLTPAAYATDTQHSGLDQLDRLAIWARLGARIVDFPYVQPALSTEQKPDEGLLYAVLEFPGHRVPAAYLHDHLESFFGVSVRKGKPLSDDAVASQQLELLRTRKSPLDLLAIAAAVEFVRRVGRDGAGADFRSLARRLGMP